MTVDHAVDSSVAQDGGELVRMALAHGLPEAHDLQTLPAWCEQPVTTERGDDDERRAERVAESLLAGVPPDPDDLSAPPPAGGDPPKSVPPPGPGRPLPTPVRRWAEGLAGTPLDHVRLHDSPEAHRSAAALAARAYAAGADIVLGREVGPPSTAAGLHTLAHEIGHVLAPPRQGRVGRDDPPEKIDVPPDPKMPRWQAFYPNHDVDQIIAELPEWLEQLKSTVWAKRTVDAVWDRAAQQAGAPANVLYPKTIFIIAENYVVSLAPDMTVLAVEERDPKIYSTGEGGMALIDLSSGVTFHVGIGTFEDGSESWVFRPVNRRKKLDGASPGQSMIAILLRGYDIPETVLKKLRTKGGKKDKEGGGAPPEPPGWSKDQVAKLKKTKAKKAPAPPTTPTDPGAAKTGSPTGEGKGDTGEGKGAGTGEGAGVGPGKGGGTGGATAPTHGPLKGPVTYDVWQGEKGGPRLVIKQDRAWTSIGLKEGESSESLEARADQALEALQASRDPANSIKLAAGAKTTGFVQPKGSTQGAAQSQAEAEKQAASTATALTPGERVPGAKGGANAEAYPSKITMAGHDPETPGVTVSGATDTFSMVLDYAARSLGFQDEVFNRLQNIQFYWEVIDVTGLTKEKADELAGKTKVGEGERETGLGAMGTNLNRDLKAIAEDEEADLQMMADENWPWEARASYLMVIGISNVVRTLGSIIGSFIDTITEPLNARSIGFDKNGDYLVRCVATPLVSDEAREDPEHHVIRASSVAVFPIRVQDINVRATEAVGREEATLAAKEAALEAARKDGSKSKIANAEAELEAVRQASRMSGFEALQSQIRQLRKSLDVAKALREHREKGVNDAEWSDEEVHLALSLLRQKMTVDTFIKQREIALEGLVGKDQAHETWAMGERNKFVAVGGVQEFRPRVVLASEETGQVTEILCMLGQISPGPDAPWQWRLVDVTSAGTRDYYTGKSALPGPAGRTAAIRDAFRNFAENGDYGRGTLAIRLPAELATALGAQVVMDGEMVSRPGPGKRFKARLADIAKVAMVAGLFATGGLGVAIGAVGGVAGAIGSVDSLVKRSRTGHLMDIGTVFDVLGVVGGVASVASVGTFYARTTAEGLAKLGKTPDWIKGLERTEKVLHIHAQIGVVQQLVTIPVELAIEWDQIEKSSDDDPKKNSRKLRAILHAAESGLISIAQLGGPITAKEEPAGGAKAKSDEPLPARSNAKDAHDLADGTGPAKPPAREASGGGSTAKKGDNDAPVDTTPPKDTPPPREKSVADQVEQAQAMARKQLERSREAEARPDDEGQPRREDEQTAVGTPKGKAPVVDHPEVGPHEPARAEAVELLSQRVGHDRQLPKPTPGAPPLKQGRFGAAVTSGKQAVEVFDKAVSEAGNREVGLYFKPDTGEFQVMVGTEHSVGRPGDGWEAVVHTHPNPENISTLRLPAPQDVQNAMMRAFAKGGTYTEFVQSILPDGSTGMARVTITTKPQFKVVVEIAASGGHPAKTIEADSPTAYAKEYGEEARYIDPDSPGYQWMINDLHDFYADRDSGEWTASGTAKPGAKAASKQPPAPTRTESQQKIDALRQEIQRQRAKADATMKKIYDDELAALAKLEEDAATGTLEEVVAQRITEQEQALAEYSRIFAPVPVAKVRGMADRLRKEASKTKQQKLKNEYLRLAQEAENLANRMTKNPKLDPRFEYGALSRQEQVAAAQDYEVVISLTDKVLQKEVYDWIDEKSARLKEDDVGRALVEEILAHVQTADALTLQQSPRASGKGAADTPEMRADVKAGIASGRYSDAYQKAFADGVAVGKELGKTDDWPYTSDGHPWEVDHVAELWMGGGDDITNYMALPKRVHTMKSAIFGQFMREYRSRRVQGEQVDIRATEPRPR